jgi:uncharacterized protein YkwD
MTQLKTRRSLRLESLESRALLSSGGPTAQEQYMLELVNQARTNPVEMASWIKSHIDANDKATMTHYGVNLDAELAAIAASKPTQPLAWNESLGSTSQSQSQYEADNQVQTHQGPGQLALGDRLEQAGYTGRVADGENSYAYANSVDHAMKAFLIDWGVSSKGHRGNLLQPDTSDDQTYAEVGIGIVATKPGSSVGPFVMTQDFGRRQGAQAELLGVVYKDQDNDHFYTPGEGQGGVTIEVDNLDNQKVASTTTSDSGGYQIPLDPGTYKVTALVNNTAVRTDVVSIGGSNVKVDYDVSQPWQGGNAPSSEAQKQSDVTTLAQVSGQSQFSNSSANVVTLPFTPTFEATWRSSWTWWKRN